MKNQIIFVVLVFLLTTQSFAQNAVDALRYSRIFNRGTARSMAMGGAFGSLGADFSVLSTNPGGIGLYKSSEFTITPSYFIGFSSTDFYQHNETDGKFSFNLGNLGLVFAIPLDKNDKSKWKNLQFGFGVNGLNKFSNNYEIKGFNPSSSLMTDWVNILNNRPGITPDDIMYDYPFDIDLAYQSNVIYYDSTNSMYRCDMPNGGVLQQKSIKISGSMNEYLFSIGGNYNDKLYIGVTIGVPVIRYYEDSKYTETDPMDTIPWFRLLEYKQHLTTKGTGINLKAGLIYRPFDWVRIGAAVHTPTYFGNMRDGWYSSMYAEFDSLESYGRIDSPSGAFDYSLTTPFRAIGSLGFIIGKVGLISAEYEYADYSFARFDSEDDNFSDVNHEIASNYKAVVNIKVGTEWRIDRMSLRAGYNLNPSPYKNNINDGKRFSVSGGIGYKLDHFFFDIAYIYAKQQEDYYLYYKHLVDPVNNTTIQHNVLMTLGVKF